ncbi:MAG: hypothetical protein VX784_07650 [Pseudomonadota bacterium]|nr:hypothetical protein [Pseudomonadota bacterium]
MTVKDAYMRRHEIYFLQRQDNGAWETLATTSEPDDLHAPLNELIATREPAGLRIVAGDYDSTAGDWRYEQIFFLDQRSFAFTAAALAMPAVVATQKETVDAATADADENFDLDFAELKRRLEAATDSDNNWAAEAPADDSALPDAATADTSPTEAPLDTTAGDDPALEETETVLAADTEDRATIIAPPPRGSVIGRVFRFLISLIIILVLAAAISLTALIILKHPLVMPYVEKFGVDKLLAVVDTGNGDTASAMDNVDTLGQVVNYVGIPSQIFGKWSPSDCKTEHITFGDDTYTVVRDGQAAPPVSVARSFEDDYHIFLQLGPATIEQFQKVDSATLRHVATITANAETPVRAPVLQRCAK